MPATDAEAITAARTGWPLVTIAAASDAFLIHWLRQIRLHVDEVIYDDAGVHDVALGHLAAHHAYRVNPGRKLPVQFSTTAGASVSEGSATVGADNQPEALTLTGEEYSKTPPGLAFLALERVVLKARSRVIA